MDDRIATLHQLDVDMAEALWLTDRKFFKELCREIHDYRQLGEYWSLPTLQFYFYRGEV